MTDTRLRIGLLATHPIQYYAPWYRALAQAVDLDVFFSHRQTPEGQAAAGFGVAFDWDVPLLEGYRHTFLRNVSRQPDVNRFRGCDTPELASVIQERAFDAFIVHGWSTKSYWQAMLACWRTGTPVLVRGDSNLQTPRAWWWRVAKYPMFRSFIPRFDGYLVVGARTREYLISYGADPAKCFETPHAVDNAFFEARAAVARPERLAIRRDLGVAEDALVFLFAGRFIDRKRPDLFVSAVAALASQGRNVAGVMVGDGPLKSGIEDAVRSSEAPVRFAGFLNQTAMARVYAASDVLVVPSTWETWGLVVNEAMACGLPAIVSSRVACAGDLVRPGDTGDVFDEGDAAGLLAAMARYTDASYRQQLARNARHHVQHFGVDVAAAGTVRALEQVTAGRRAPRACVRSTTSIAAAPDHHGINR
jgi:glycosyltransferase involved in cell wall biosynthesis